MTVRSRKRTPADDCRAFLLCQPDAKQTRMIQPSFLDDDDEDDFPLEIQQQIDAIKDTASADAEPAQPPEPMPAIVEVPMPTPRRMPPPTAPPKPPPTTKAVVPRPAPVPPPIS
jgi:hypothetical protein